MFLNNNWTLLEFLKTFMNVYVQQVFVNVRRNFTFSGHHVRQVLKNYLQPCINKIWRVYVILQKKKFYQKFLKNCDQKTSSRPFCVCKELKRNLYWKMKFLKEAADIRLYISKTIKMCPNQYTDLLRFLFTGDSLKIKKGL